jgi:hypothetical protein
MLSWLNGVAVEVVVEAAAVVVIAVVVHPHELTIAPACKIEAILVAPGKHGREITSKIGKVVRVAINRIVRRIRGLVRLTEISTNKIVRGTGININRTASPTKTSDKVTEISTNKIANPTKTSGSPTDRKINKIARTSAKKINRIDKIAFEKTRKIDKTSLTTITMVVGMAAVGMVVATMLLQDGVHGQQQPDLPQE